MTTPAPAHSAFYDVIIYFGDGTKACMNRAKHLPTGRDEWAHRIADWLQRRGSDVCWFELRSGYGICYSYPVLYSPNQVMSADKDDWSWR